MFVGDLMLGLHIKFEKKNIFFRATITKEYRLIKIFLSEIRNNKHTCFGFIPRCLFFVVNAIALHPVIRLWGSRERI
jgi:hypothetical protein